MWTLGKFVVMTNDELEQRNNDERALGYRAGLRSKWRAKKKGEVESLLAAVAPGVVIPSRNAETYSIKDELIERGLSPETIAQFNVKESEAEDAA